VRSIEPELELLLWVARRAGSGNDRTPRPERALDWPAFRRAAVAHGLVPQIDHRLGAWLRETMPPEESLRWGDLVRANALRALRLTAALRAIVERFDQSGIPVLGFKGPALARLLYGDVSLRSYCDLDLFVRREHVTESAGLLEGLGIRGLFRGTPAQERLHLRNCHALSFASAESGMLVDLHWGLFPHERGSCGDPEELFRRAQNIELEGRPLRTLGPEDTLIHLCAHGAEDRWGRLSQVADLAALLASREWDGASLLGRAEELGRRRSLLLGLALAEALAGANLPPEVAAARRAERGLECLFRRARVGLVALRPPDPAPTLRGALFQAGTRDGWPERLRYLRNRAFLPVKEDLAAFPLPEPLHPLYAILRPIRLASRYGGTWLRESAARLTAARRP
jgi:hypothetical protein